MSSIKHSDVDLYQRLCEPFPSIDSANDSLDGFFEEFRIIREKYGIPDVVLIARLFCIDESKKQDVILTMSCGDPGIVFPMVSNVFDRQRKKFIEDKKQFPIPISLMNEDKFVTAYLLFMKLAKDHKEVEQLIKNGEIEIDHKPILFDGPAQQKDFELTFRGETVMISGRKDRPILK